MAQKCAPSIAPVTLASIAHVESGNNPHALHNNTTGKSLVSGDVANTRQTASDWLAAGHSIDVGLMQINSSNFGWLGIDVEDALDPCISMAAAGQILTEGFAGGDTEAQRQTALRVALSRYNTGSPERGFSNGYVDKVVAAANHVVPAIQVEDSDAAKPLPPEKGGMTQSNWNVWEDDKPGELPMSAADDLSHWPPSKNRTLPTVSIEKTARLSRIPPK